MTDSSQTPDTPEPEETEQADVSSMEAAESELFVEDILETEQSDEAAAESDAEDSLDGSADPESELVADLRRVTAEYANYRKRVEANRETDIEQSMRQAAFLLLPILDDLDRAAKHGDLDGEGAFAQIATKMRQAAERLGLASFGEAGEAFDPQRHEAILQQPSPEATAETVLEVVEVGYTLGSTLIRAAKVVVSVPA